MKRLLLLSIIFALVSVLYGCVVQPYNHSLGYRPTYGYQPYRSYGWGGNSGGYGGRSFGWEGRHDGGRGGHFRDGWSDRHGRRW